MIITRILGGLGNQMFQYAIAKSIAQKNNDIFKLDISWCLQTSIIHGKYDLNQFNIEENFARDNECKALRGNENFLFKVKRKLGFQIVRPKAYICEPLVVKFHKDIYDNTQKDIYLDGFWHNENYFKNIRSDILKDFTLKEEVGKNAQKYLIKIQSTNSVCIHIRRGDYVTDTGANNVHGVLSLDYYKKAIKYVSVKVKNPVFFIFSNDIEWCKANFDFLGSKLFVDNTQSAIEDLELMKNCKHNINANSSFSWWGAWLNENKDKIVVAPKKWFACEKWKELNTACNSWVVI